MGKSIVHGLVSLGLFGIPLLIGVHAGWQDMTIGAVLNAGYHWLLTLNK